MVHVVVTLYTWLMGIVYPAYASFQAIESDSTEDDKQWISYWIIFGGFIIVKEFIDQIFFWLPFYEYFGPVFVTLMVHPRVQGARKVYNMFVKPFFTELSAVESGKIKLDELDEHEKLVFQAVLKALEVVRAILSRGLCQKVYEKVYPVATRCIDIFFLKDHVLERVKRRGSSGGDENSADEETKKDD